MYAMTRYAGTVSLRSNRSACLNAVNSPLLSMFPPEVRNRIWDCLFEDLIVRIDSQGLYSSGTLRSYQQTNCRSSRPCEKWWRERQIERIVRQGSRVADQAPPACEKHKQYEMPVQVLQVCRQIYHEAVLKPFTQPTFEIIMATNNRGKVSFFDQLVPVQARAISHVQLRRLQSVNLTKVLASRLKGVKHVMMEIRSATSLHDSPLTDMESFKKKDGIEWLKSLGLASMRFTVWIGGIDPPTETLTTSILEWISREEREIVLVASSKKRKRSA